jgi:hypothetical protein
MIHQCKKRGQIDVAIPLDDVGGCVVQIVLVLPPVPREALGHVAQQQCQPVVEAPVHAGLMVAELVGQPEGGRKIIVLKINY